MKDKEKAAFLRAEGWKPMSPIIPGRGGEYWIDEAAKGIWMQCRPFDKAYLLAKRRKSQREARLLRKAGWIVCNEGGWHKGGFFSGCLSRGEAVKLLSQRKGS